MAHYYLDSSALVKAYVTESGTAWIRNLCSIRAGHTLYTIRVSGAEIIAAFFRRVRTGSLTLSDAQKAAIQFKTDFHTRYQIVEVTQIIIEQAMQLAEKHGLRGYDSIQLSAALQLHSVRNALSLDPITFVCADEVLNNIALIEGLACVNPNTV